MSQSTASMNNTQQTIPGANLLLLGMCLSVMTYWFFALSMLAVGPMISESLKVDAAEMAFPMGFAGLISGILIVPAGVMADRFGCLRMLRVGLVFALIGAVVCAFATGLNMMVVGRFIQGVSAALVMPATLALLKLYFSEEDRPKAVSFWSMSSFGSAGVCSFFGGIVGKYLGWEWIFYLVIPVVCIAFYLMRNAPESEIKKQTSKFDMVGFVVLLLALMAINLLINKGATWGWKSLPIIGCLVVFVVLLPVFIAVEKKHPAPIIDLSMLKNKTYDGSVVANFLLNTGLGVMFILATYLQKGRGLDPFQASLMTLSYLVLILTMIRVGEKVGKKLGARPPMMYGALCSSIGFFIMSFTFISGSAYYIVVLIGYALMGIGNGLFATPATSIAVGEAPSDKVGAATAIFKMGSSLGGSLGIAICGALYAMVLSSDPESIHKAAQYAIMFCGFALLVASFISMTFIPKKQVE